MPTITRKERAAIIQSLGAGVVPAIGLHHIQVGRRNEVAAIIEDLKHVENGSSSIRFVVGRFGSGKTFFLNVMRTVALERGFVALQADITTDRRFHGSRGQARSLYSELMKNLATRSRPEGGAMSNLIEKWIGELDHAIRSKGGNEDDVKIELQSALKPLQDLVSGFDFVTVLSRYYDGYLTDNDELQIAALRWLRAEYSTKTEARQALGVRTIIDDNAIYEYLKLFAAFVRIAGYKGLLVNTDELVVLSHRLNNTVARNNNYESILRILNDCLQGRTEGLLFLLAGTDECIEDRRRGLYSYEALATRLAPNKFASETMRDYSSPIVKLDPLTPEDCFVLLCNIRKVCAGGESSRYLIPDDGIKEYLRHCSERMGAAYFQTPRDTVKDFVGLLKVLEQNPSANWRDLLGSPDVSSEPAREAGQGRPSESGDLTEFKL